MHFKLLSNAIFVILFRVCGFWVGFFLLLLSVMTIIIVSSYSLESFPFFFFFKKLFWLQLQIK